MTTGDHTVEDLEQHAAVFLEYLSQLSVAWHVTRYPHSEDVHVALKLCEEAGEVGRAINQLGPHGRIRENDSTVLQESADVFICLLVLLRRWGHGTIPELLQEVQNKLMILESRG